MDQDLEDLLSPENLRRLVARKPIGDAPPWRQRFSPKRGSRVIAVADHLQGRRSLVVEGPHDQGSGYASFVELFVYPRNGSTCRDLGG